MSELNAVAIQSQFLQPGCQFCSDGSYSRYGFVTIKPDKHGVSSVCIKELDGKSVHMVFHGRREQTQVMVHTATYKLIKITNFSSDKIAAGNSGVISGRRLPQFVQIAPETWNGRAQQYFGNGETLLGSLDEYTAVRLVALVPPILKRGGFVVFGDRYGRPRKIVTLPLMHLALRQ